MVAPTEESAQPVREFEDRLGYTFRDPGLLLQALTHSSFRGTGGGPDNERLEFLGDSIVGFLVSEALYRLLPSYPEGKLSRIKSNLVSAPSFHRVAEEMNLGRYLQLGPGEEKTGGRAKQALLADAVEAVVAALYLDGGMEPARKFVEERLLVELERQGLEVFASADYKTALQEYLQARRMPAARYETARSYGPDHKKTFLVELSVGERRLAEGQGGTKKAAEQRAAHRALDLLVEEEPVPEAREQGS